MTELKHDLFEELIGPTSLEDFMSDSWGNKPFYAAGGAERVSALVDDSIAAFKPMLEGNQDPSTWGQETITLDAAYEDIDGCLQEVHGISPILARDLYKAGMTICARAIDRKNQQLTRFVDSVRNRVKYTGDMRIDSHMSPDGKGLGWHWDYQHVFIIQLEGSKRWQFHEKPALEWPPCTIFDHRLDDPGADDLLTALGISIYRPEPGVETERVLQPGDLLYLPPGTWHRTCAQGRSFAITLTLFPVPFIKLLRLTLFLLALRNPSWRQDSNLFGWESERPGTLSPQQKQFLSSRLSEALATLGKISPEALMENFYFGSKNADVTGVIDAFCLGF